MFRIGANRSFPHRPDTLPRPLRPRPASPKSRARFATAWLMAPGHTTTPAAVESFKPGKTTCSTGLSKCNGPATSRFAACSHAVD